jgi:hypothetical protein
MEERSLTAATLLAMLTGAKLKMLPPSMFESEGCSKSSKECLEASKCYGRLKVLGKAQNGPKLRQTLIDCGGDAKELTDAELIEIWGANEHRNLHCCLFGVEDIYHAVHMTSLNDNSMNPSDGDKTLAEHGPLGGYNDKGNHPQWGWFRMASKYFDFIGIDQ